MPQTIRNVGIIGAGQMGSGIAHVCALAGYSVLLNDISIDRVRAGMATINGNMARRGKTCELASWAIFTAICRAAM
jgi:3-hydroxybutyryl-CoA dehydrogenase